MFHSKYILPSLHSRRNRRRPGQARGVLVIASSDVNPAWDECGCRQLCIEVDDGQRLL